MLKCFIIGNARSATTQISKAISSHPFIDHYRTGDKYSSEMLMAYAKSSTKFNKSETKHKIEDLLDNFHIIKEIMVSPDLSVLSEILSYSRNHIFSNKKIFIVRTIRNNKLQQSLSSEIAIQTNCWHKSNNSLYYNKDYVSLLKKLKPISIENIKKRILSLKYGDKILDDELKNVKNIKIEYENFYFNKSTYQNDIINEIFNNMYLECVTGDLIKNEKLNCQDYYKFIPNINEIEKEFSNIENGFLFV